MAESQINRKHLKKDGKRMGRPDLLLIAGLLAAGLAGMSAVRLLAGKNGTFVRITVDGNLYGTYSLADEQVISVEADESGAVTNVLKISGGEAKMTEADCPDKLCVHQNSISRQGETIVCLPNRVVVEITGEDKAEFDSIAR